MEDSLDIPMMVYLWSLGKSVFSGAVGFWTFMFWTRYFDRRAQINWRRDVWPQIAKGNHAMGVYMGCRILACAAVSISISLAIR